MKLRLPQLHSKQTFLLEESYRFLAGFQGEQIIDQFVQQAKISGHFAYLPNVTITLTPNKKSQIDGLFIHEKYILIIEVKNMKGELFFETTPSQLIQKTEEGDKAYSCPQIQVISAAYILKEFLLSHKIFDLPVYCVIAMPNRKTIIRKPPKKVKLLFGRELPLYIEKLNELPAIINKLQIKKLIKAIEKNQSQIEFEPLANKYNINVQDIKKGVICECGQSGKRISQRIWTCTKCQKKIERPIEQVIEDWFLLIKSTISIQEGMSFLKINDRNHVRRAFKKSGLESKGHSRNIVYFQNNLNLNHPRDKS